MSKPKSLTFFIVLGGSLCLTLLFVGLYWQTISEWDALWQHSKQAEQRLRFLAHFDPLTQLANRNQLLQRLELLVGAGCPLALLFIDIDHFKRINDTLGHEIGDRLLAEIAERLRQHMPANSLLARSGGDEFVCLLEGANADDGKNLGSELLNLFNQPFQVRQYSCKVSPSIGLTLCNGQQGSASDLLKQADLALYAAKDAGRNGLALFTPELSRAAELRQQLEQELRLALEREEFELFYQPQVDASGQAQSMEALLRWRSPSRGLVSPADFIPVLEETGLILEATRWVFRQACRQARRWQSEGRHWRIAVNLSPLDFRQHDLAGQLLQILADEQASASWLELEITESALLDDGPQVRDCLARLKIAGLPLFLDDFGTGYSSLGYLQSAPFDKIKIDQSFVRGATQPGSRNGAIIASITSLAEALHMDTTAEGVETLDELELVRLLGCSHIQGYIYFKPMNAADATALVSGDLVAEADGPQCARVPRQNLLRKVTVIHNNNRLNATLRNISESGAMIEIWFWVAAVGAG